MTATKLCSAHFLRHLPREYGHPFTEREVELLNARRALRVASWFSIFYLITTDILGPFNAPFAFSQVGYVPGVTLYVFMGMAAAYTGLILWHLYIRLDSDTYPIKTYADLADRIFGKWAKQTCIILQSIQLIINVGTLCLTNGQSVEQIAAGPSGPGQRFCFSVAIIIWIVVGMAIGQIRTLKNYGWLANSYA
jgi:amino acid permease